MSARTAVPGGAGRVMALPCRALKRIAGARRGEFDEEADGMPRPCRSLQKFQFTKTRKIAGRRLGRAAAHVATRSRDRARGAREESGFTQSSLRLSWRELKSEFGGVQAQTTNSSAGCSARPRLLGPSSLRPLSDACLFTRSSAPSISNRNRLDDSVMASRYRVSKWRTGRTRLLVFLCPGAPLPGRVWLPASHCSPKGTLFSPELDAAGGMPSCRNEEGHPRPRTLPPREK